MLGSALTKVLENSTTTVVEFNRAGESITGNNRAVKMNAREPINFDTLKQFDYVVNAIGYIKQIIDNIVNQRISNADIQVAQTTCTDDVRDVYVYYKT